MKVLGLGHGLRVKVLDCTPLSPLMQVKSYQNAMSEMHNGVNAMELVANLHAEVGRGFRSH